MRGLAIPPRASDRQREIVDRLDDPVGLLVGLDFDGTLAPIAADPDAPVITPACRRVLARLAARVDVTAAVISGRALADLRDRVDLDGVVYAGNHGLELDRGTGPVAHPAAARHRPALRRLLDDLPGRLAGIPGWEIEDKGLSATVHVRRTPSRQLDAVRAAVSAAVDAADAPIAVRPGKQVIELRPAVEWNKGAAIELIAEETPAGWRTVYVGDDVTDDDAFRAVRPAGVGVLVGSRSNSAADYRLPDQPAVAPFLDWLVDGVLDGDPTVRS